MSQQIYNTLTRRKETFETIQSRLVTMYVCGPTVYDKAHVGHAMSALAFDVIRRYLEHGGYQVRHVMNYTDVDDKLIRRGRELDVNPIHLAERYIGEFEKHIADLGLLRATVYPRATEEIPRIIALIERLVAKGHAYAIEGDVYFRVKTDGDYGKLSGRRLEEMRAGARIAVDERKEDPVDFALWKAAKPGEPSWESPWGSGRPGWHIECSAMILRHLGERIDIHGGGNDLIFPHHENEIAQSESATGQPLARYWAHNGMMQLAGEKMSKSIGNLVTIEEFLARHEADVLRMMVLGSHYRSPLTFSDETVTQATSALERLRSALRPVTSASGGADAGKAENLERQIEASRKRFLAAMEDDFNTAGALGHLFDIVRVIHQACEQGLAADRITSAQDQLRLLMGVLGLHSERPAAAGDRSAAFIELLIDMRNELRGLKLWALADRIRDRLDDLGVLIEDAREGTTWRRR
ncbi:MAG: cysteine--tRNA ligase [Vicinamibacteria bacterium]|nr:cysteine--tRNA ligase [Vicinamibacteria bacterium]